MKGSTLPRLSTPPLGNRRAGAGCVPGCDCGLTPATSRGFEVIEWATRIGVDLMPWQRWLLIHALELDEACERLRFRTILVLVARQNGKTTVKAVLSLWRMFQVEPYKRALLVGTAQDLSQAAEVLNEVLVPMILDCPELRERFDPEREDQSERRGIWSKQNNNTFIRLDSRWVAGRAVAPHGPRYLIKALNRYAGRGLAKAGEVNIDELREQRDFAGWAAISKTVLANPDGPQIWCMSNAGDKQSVLLNQLRGVALGGQDPTLFHAEWSASDQAALGDETEWARANPALGRTLSIEALRSAYRQDPPAVFRTEVLCRSVDVLETAVDLGAWVACEDRAGSGQGSPAVCVEAAADGDGVVAVAAWPMEGRARLNVVAAWRSTAEAKAELRSLKQALRPRSIGWFPKGPGARLSATLRKLGGVEIKSTAMAEACMTFADHVEGRQLTHAGDPLLDRHVEQTGMVSSGSGSWMFDRIGDTHGTWAAAGALHLLLNGPKPRSGRRTILLGTEDEAA